jgi:hypothetical protein
MRIPLLIGVSPRTAQNDIAVVRLQSGKWRLKVDHHVDSVMVLHLKSALESLEPVISEGLMLDLMTGFSGTIRFDKKGSEKGITIFAELITP